STVTRFADTGGSQMVARSTFAYDGVGQLTRLTHHLTTGTDLTYDLSYDDSRRITRITDPDGTTTYTYHRRDELTGADPSDPWLAAESYGYDDQGNRVASNGIGETFGPGNRLLSDGTYAYSYDDEGNLTERTRVSDTSKRDFSWDYRGRLVGVTDRNAS